MNVITRSMRARLAARAWGGQYPDGEKADIYNALVALGDSPNPDDVDKVIGNRSWTRLSCDECGEDVQMVLQVGEQPDYESATAELCAPCVANAFELTNMTRMSK